MLQNTKQFVTRAASVVVGIALFAVALVFAWVLAIVVGVLVLGVWAYLAWRFRSLEKQAGARGARSDGPVVIEGEYRIEHDAGGIDPAPADPDARTTPDR